MKKLALFIMLAFLLLTTTLLPQAAAGPCGRVEWVFEIILPDGEKLSLTPVFLKSLEQKEVTIVVEEQQRTYQGVLLQTILENKGYSQEGLEGLRFIAEDGYVVQIPPEIFRNRNILLAIFRDDGQKLPENEYPLRVVIPGEEMMYWVRNCVRAELEGGLFEIEVDAVYLFSSLAEKMGVIDSRVLISSIVEELNPIGDFIFFSAADGHTKTERLSDIPDTYIDPLDNGVPTFSGEKLHAGRQVKGLSSIQLGREKIVFWSNWIKDLPPAEINGEEGIALDKFVEKAGLDWSNGLKIEAVDGYSVEISLEDIQQGIIKQLDDGSFRVHFSHLPRNFHIRGILLIKALDGEV